MGCIGMWPGSKLLQHCALHPLIPCWAWQCLPGKPDPWLWGRPGGVGQEPSTTDVQMHHHPGSPGGQHFMPHKGDQDAGGPLGRTTNSIRGTSLLLPLPPEKRRLPVPVAAHSQSRARSTRASGICYSFGGTGGGAANACVDHHPQVAVVRGPRISQPLLQFAPSPALCLAPHCPLSPPVPAATPHTPGGPPPRDGHPPHRTHTVGCRHGTRQGQSQGHAPGVTLNVA